MSNDINNEVAEKIKKLLKLASSPNTNEAAAAAAKAQKLLEDYNLTMDDVESSRGENQRVDEKIAEVFASHDWQESLWHSVAELNFCLHGTYWAKKFHGKHRTIFMADGSKKEIPVNKWEWRYVKSHRIIGKKVNVAISRHMAIYLEAAIERALSEQKASWKRTGYYVTNADYNSFRIGAAYAITNRIWDRRSDRLSKERAAHKKAMEAADAQFSGGTALALATYIDKETDANLDFLHGEGYSAKKAAERRAQQQKEAAFAAMSEAEYTAWAAANPEEARARAKATKEQERWSKSQSKGKTVFSGTGYWAGKSAGDKISLDEQVGGSSNARMIT